MQFTPANGCKADVSVCLSSFRVFSTHDIFTRRDVATFVNSYPTLDVNYELAKGDYTASSPILITVSLTRDADEDDAAPSRSSSAGAVGNCDAIGTSGGWR